ncbi:hypothetical protein [Halopseudomonas maritima]|uniref:hypothetical protein n=1 Tax=Halopseudomonas maritima TaxID=2918528 RepID=UPI001EECA59B|nr:hypothetical protein [Halopseudomonas maritima]UJJ31895.1 hypothetical protein HV822_01590 [Halopseudomonas maritima]
MLWYGAYRLNQLNIAKTDGEQQVPLVRLQRTDIKIRPCPFWEHGAIVAEVDLYVPQLTSTHAYLGMADDRASAGLWFPPLRLQYKWPQAIVFDLFLVQHGSGPRNIR